MRSLLLAASLLLPVSAHAQTLTPAAEKAMHEGEDLVHGGVLDAALARFRTAAKESNNAPEAVAAIIRVETEMRDYKGAAATADSYAKIAATPEERAHGSMMAAQASFAAWIDAEREASAGLAAAPSNEPLRALHARILAAQKHDDDASREFLACSTTPGISPAECARTTRLAHNTASARNVPAPPFTATTLDGQPVSLDSLAGKVVLLDFWATWCHYCLADSDYVQSLLDSFPTKKFVLLEVNVEDDPDKVRNFVRENHLEGVQVQDRRSELQTAFNVAGYPTYVILDENGTERFRISGAQGDLRGTVKKLLAEASDQPTPKPSGQ